MQRRNKVGGIMDKRFGENDPTMAPEDKMLERFTQEKLRRHKTSSAFDLEDDDESGQLTHMGQSLSLDGPALKDDFDEEGLELSDADDHPSDDERRLKRRRGSQSEGSDDEDAEDGKAVPERKKSKQEVMKEVIAKSKAYKYERQAAKDDDEDLREELDKELSSIHALLRGERPKPAAPAPAEVIGMNPDRLALLNGTEKAKFDKEYDMRLKQMAQDKRSKPTERSKTEEEKMIEEARRLQELESKRLRRMQGEAEDSEEETPAGGADDLDLEEEEEEEEDYGLGAGIKTKSSRENFGVEDEDDFIIDDDLVASGSEIEESDSDDTSSDAENSQEEEEDDDFLDGLLTAEEAKRPEFLTGANAPIQDTGLPENNGVNGNLAYTYSCPESQSEFLEITKNVNILDLPTVVQRIRALYHPKLKAENKSKLGNFAVALIDHISYLANSPKRPPFSVLETLIRHVHSMAKTYPVEIANNFRKHLEEIHESRALAPTSGDLVLLTAIGTIFPTSDHFHQVVTPAILTMARFLGQKIPQTHADYATGAYLGTLCLQYQRLSKRYVPEIVSFVLNTLCVLSPTKLSKIPGTFPYHEPKQPMRISSATNISSRQITFYDTAANSLSGKDESTFKLALLETNVKLLEAASETWTGKSAFTEVFAPALEILSHLQAKESRGQLPKNTQVSKS
jgi:nucleolar protein 14